MRYRLLLIIVIILFFLKHSFAQNRFYEKGYVITLKGDTINGYIKKIRNSLLSLGIDFKTNLKDTNAANHYKPEELQSFYFPSDNMKFDQVIYTDNDKHNTVKKLFGLLLVSGKISLYRLNLMDSYNTTIFETNNDHVYLIKNDTGFVVLRMKEWIEEAKYYLDKEYIQVLNKLLKNCDVVRSKIDGVGFEDTEMKDLINSYNNCSSTIKNVVYNHSSSLKIKKGITASYYSLVSYQPVNNSTAFSVGYFWDILDPQIYEYISVMTGINYFKPGNTDYYGKNYLSVPILATINLSDKKTAPFINIGTTAYFYNFYQLDGFNLNLGLGTYIRVYVNLITG